MNSGLRAQWTVIPTRSPEAWRHCRACGATRPFASSGKVRLNANGRVLDAWLIYRCIKCDGTWNRPILERIAVSSLARSDLDAMQCNDRAWVRAREFDVAALARDCDRVDAVTEVSVSKPPPIDTGRKPARLDLTIDAPFGTGIRLDRLLARELAVSRSQLRTLERAGCLTCDSAAKLALRRFVSGKLSVTFRPWPSDRAGFLELCRAAYARE